MVVSWVFLPQSHMMRSIQFTKQVLLLTGGRIDCWRGWERRGESAVHFVADSVIDRNLMCANFLLACVSEVKSRWDVVV